MLTVIFDNREIAGRNAAALGTKTVSESGRHVPNNMERILSVRDERGHRRYSRNTLPRTDNILESSFNLSVGVVDPGLGASFGINIRSTDETIERQAKKFIEAVSSCL